MNDQQIIFSPEHNQWTLTDGRHHMEVPEWAREIMRGEFERETRTLQAENDRLRELVMIAVKHCDSGTCDGCPIMGEDESCPYSDMARELGVEVDG